MSAFREMLPFGSYPVLKCFLSVNARLSLCLRSRFHIFPSLKQGFFLFCFAIMVIWALRSSV